MLFCKVLYGIATSMRNIDCGVSDVFRLGGLGERLELPNGVLGGAPDANDLNACCSQIFY